MTHYDLVIIGTGSGNTIVNRRFADQKVAIVERGTFGGTCLNVGCIPTKMFVHAADVAATPSVSSAYGVDEQLLDVRWTDVRDRIFGRIDPIAEGGSEYRHHNPDNANVHVYDGTGRFTGFKELTVDGKDGSTSVFSADQFVIASGSRPIVPPIPGLEETGYHTSNTIMRLEELPRRLAIIGGGFVAAEFAHVFASFGVEVTIVARSNELLRLEDGEIAARYTEVARDKYDVRLNHETVRVERRDDGSILLGMLNPDGADELIVDELLVAVGREPNSDLLNLDATGVDVDREGRVVVDAYQQTSVDGIYALGDVTSPLQLKHVANHEARVVKHNLLNPDDRIEADHRFVPHAVFSAPQIASVGLTEEQAQERGIPYVKAVQSYADIAYGWAMEDTTGFAKVLADPTSGQIIGCHVIGPQAPTVIQPVIQAMSFGLDAYTMARGQYWIHPAMPELIENALLKLDLHPER
ncbi:mycothione reductase [Kribbella sp. VKM Ac-2569]|uniref:mycothione reductase n=1 Tax=Kribbella sp. VKM Ac-2569 TaxID=2512220 RepID=UPI00102B1E37|nr:mycothione reductase [Kribbella sp. VKM Ac-2569]RZT20338.1 mycothione reductase [Kribbella sp. VKM Ac-2569]